MAEMFLAVHQNKVIAFTEDYKQAVELAGEYCFTQSVSPTMLEYYQFDDRDSQSAYYAGATKDELIGRFFDAQQKAKMTK